MGNGVNCILRTSFDLILWETPYPDGKSKNPLFLLDHSDRSDQFFERIYLSVPLRFGGKKMFS